MAKAGWLLTDNMRDLWGITTFFNPAGYRRRLENYRHFRRHLPVPLLAVELSFDGRFDLGPADADMVVQIDGGAVLWQKERLLNVALAALPPTCTMVAWLDCDVVFGRPDWSEAVASGLERHVLLQPFSHVHFMPPGWSPDAVGGAAVDVKHPPAFLIAGGASVEAAVAFAGRDATQPAYTPGIAWAARRELIMRHMLYDACIMGGGDGALMRAAYGFPSLTRDLQRMSPERYDDYRAWAEPFGAAVGRERVGFVAGDAYHLWHGVPAKRRYTRRHADFAPFAFDPSADIAVAPNGAWRWSSPKPEMHAFLHAYFVERREDEE